MKKAISLTVNGELSEVWVRPGTTLADLLRNELGLTGTKIACNTGACASCTVLLDGKAVVSCQILALQAEGKKVLTIEGLAKDGKLHHLQEAWVQYGASQCGFCSPGMIMSAKALLDENPHPTEEEVRVGIAGNLCRCTGYVKIVEAIMAASEKM